MSHSPPSKPGTLAAALALHQAGRLAEAERAYRELLRAEPNNVEALRLLGHLALQANNPAAAAALLARASQLIPPHEQLLAELGDALLAAGKPSDAADTYTRVLALNPRRADVETNLGFAQARLGKQALAIAHYRKALVLDAGLGAAHFNLGIALHDLGQTAEAAASYASAAALEPDSDAIQFNLGCAQLELENVDGATASFRRAIAINPQHAGAHANLGKALLQAGHLDQACAALREAVRLDDNLLEAHASLIAALHRSGDGAAALRAAERAVRLPAQDAGVLNNYALVLREHGRFEESIDACRRAVALDPAVAEAHDNLGNALVSANRLDEAIASYRNALTVAPTNANVTCNLGIALRDQGKLEEAVAAFRSAIALEPKLAGAYSGLLFTLQLKGGESRDDIFAEHRRFGAQFKQAGLPSHDAINKDPQRRIRVGYVSGDFRRHSVAYFFEPVLQHHAAERVETFCYSTNSRCDAVTLRLRKLAAHWRECYSLSDDQMATRIREDQIDILVDLSGHTGFNRLPVFARKPAPLQLTWLGYSDTTGLDAMDFRITDHFVSPPGQSEASHSEQLLRLPHAFLCYQPPDDAPDVSSSPATQHGHVTFGSFNYLGKITDAMVSTWARILERVPGSVLLLKNKSLDDDTVRRETISRMAALGIPEDRLQLLGFEADVASHLSAYRHIDIALDTFPYVGGTTTCEALWMGVPVISLVGDTYVSRMGLTLLTNAGHPAWAATNEAAYIDAAVAMASDISKLSAQRAAQREKLRGMPLFDAALFTREMEDAYRTIWRAWCGSKADQKGSASIEYLSGGERKVN